LSVNKLIKKEISGIINLRFTYKNVPVTVLEKLTFEEPREVLKDICALGHIHECVVLQTCNRIEIYAVTAENFISEAAVEIAEYWRRRSNFGREEFYQNLEQSFDYEALIHLLRLASGLESMIVGEDQILGQVQKAFEEAKECGTVGWILKTIFEKAIITGRKVRFKTRINKGTVSIGSAAVELLEESLGSLRDKKILIIGAGETGGLVGKALASRKHAVIFMANRTYERGVRLARMLGGYAVRFDKIKELLATVDAAIVATSAPHYIITKRLVEEILEKRMGKKLFIMDLSQPRNVEEEAANLFNVELRNIDDLRGIAEKNLEMRRREIEKAESIIKDELKRLELILKRERAEPVIAALCSKAEEIRRRELKKALRMLGEISDKQQKVINDLTLVLIEQVLYEPILNIRKAAINGDFDTILVAQKLFDLNLFRSE
jgi:glutamyl-tRNA reductase